MAVSYSLPQRRPYAGAPRRGPVTRLLEDERWLAALRSEGAVAGSTVKEVAWPSVTVSRKDDPMPARRGVGRSRACSRTSVGWPPSDLKERSRARPLRRSHGRQLQSPAKTTLCRRAAAWAGHAPARGRALAGRPPI